MTDTFMIHKVTITIGASKHTVRYGTTVGQLCNDIGIQRLYNSYGKVIPYEVPLRGNMTLYYQ